MIHILNTIPRNVIVACSGGVDSMVCVDFLKNNHNIKIAYFHHGTEHSEKAFFFVKNYCIKNKITFIYSKISDERKPKGFSQEEYWRNERYAFLNSLNEQVITCHHLDDVLETWIMSSMNGDPKIIPYRNKNVIRPFLVNKKETFLEYSSRKNVSYENDPSNNEERFQRNYVRKNIVPKYLEISNNGIYSVLRKKVKKENFTGE